MNKNYINGCLRWLVNELFPYYNTNSLPENFETKMSKFYDQIRSTVDWYNLTIKDVQRLGFLNWEDDPTDGVWFIPAWLFYAIPEGMTVWDKNNIAFEFHQIDAPKEVMYGCLTFGVYIAEFTDSDL